MDIGGANTKFASFDSKFIESHYLPLWKGADIFGLFTDIKKRVNPSIVSVVMTGELSDCFSGKDEGVLWIYENVISVFPNAKFLNINCTFKDDVRSDPKGFAAANWVASSNFLGKKFKDALFIDMGSTTTDIIPIEDGKPTAEKTDYERLKRNELIYSGLLRTNIAVLLPKVKINGGFCSTSSELFAVTADAYLMLGDISKEEYACETPDTYAFENTNESKSKESAFRRISKVVCADPDELGYEGALSIAKQVKEHQINELTLAINAIKDRCNVDMIIACGIGELLVKEAACQVDIKCILTSELYGKNVSSVLPAYAASRLLKDEM